MTGVALANYNFSNIQVCGINKEMLNSSMPAQSGFSSYALFYNGDTSKSIMKKANGNSRWINDNGTNIFFQLINNSVNNSVTNEKDAEYTKFQNNENIVIKTIFWGNDCMKAVVLGNNNTTLQNAKELNGVVEFCGKLQFPSLGEWEYIQDENYREPVVYAKELNGVVEFCGELQFPLLD